MPLKQQLIALQSMLIREYFRFIRIWVQTVLPPAITTVLYFIIFGELIGSQLADIGGYRYMDYIAPGLILMSVITNAYANVVSSFYSSKFQRHIEELLISPVPNFIILTGFVGGGIMRGLSVGLAVTVVTVFFAEIPLSHLGLILAVAVLTCILFSLAGFINGIYAKSFDDISIIPTFVLTPLTYLGGIFYSLDMLSPFWQQVSLFNPILHMIGLFRYGWMGIQEVDTVNSLLLIIAVIVMLTYACLRLLKRGVGIRP